jgi:hypothetical protein
MASYNLIQIQHFFSTLRKRQFRESIALLSGPEMLSSKTDTVCGVLNGITYSDFSKQGETIFTVSYGGTGKTYFINLLLAEIRQKIIICIVF